MTKVALIGLGEVGSVLATELRAGGHEVSAFDVAFGQPSSRAAVNARRLGLPADGSMPDVLEGAALVVSAVTAAECAVAARNAAPHLTGRPWYVDLNSASPAHKREAAEVVASGGGRYVEVALMSAIEPRRLSSPMLLGGPDADAFAEVAPELGLTDVTVCAGPLGTAAATKLCRSVVIKGLEALFTEALLAARHHGVDREVLASLTNMLPEGDWEALAGYFVERSLRHGTRRAEEMDEAAWTVAEAGVEPLMSRATAERQRWAGALAIDTAPADSLGRLLDALAPALLTGESADLRKGCS